ncbi:MAG: hypothetical protein EPO06_04705 [Burkholderiaceae bacterium]|nr:MAG: hypothetical protein EPO06_04705 [Burkholderiaceae bacterium]
MRPHLIHGIDSIFDLLRLSYTPGVSAGYNTTQKSPSCLTPAKAVPPIGRPSVINAYRPQGRVKHTDPTTLSILVSRNTLQPALLLAEPMAQGLCAQRVKLPKRCARLQ